MVTAAHAHALVYCRISLDDGTVPSVEDQEAQCLAHAAKRGYDVVDVYVDNGISASKFADRPQWRRMLADLEAGKGDVVLTRHIDRLTRQPAELMQLSDVAIAAGAVIDRVHGGLLDPAHPSDEFMGLLESGLGRMFARDKAIKQKDAQAARRAEGTRTNTTRPFGYETDGVTLRPTEANLIREASQAVLDGLTFYKVARIFRDSGLKTVGDEYRLKKWVRDGNDPDKFRPNGWPVASVSKMLTRARNAGIVEHKGVIVPDVVGQWEPIITPDELMTIRARLGARKGAPVRDKEPRFWLTNIARCGGCGHRMHSHYTHDVPHLQCEGRTRRLRTDIGHGVVRMHIAETKVRNAIIASYFTDRQVSGLDERADLAVMDAANVKIAEKRTEHARLSAAIAQVDDPAPLIKLINECTAVIAEQQQIIERIQSASAHAKMVAGLRERLTRTDDNGSQRVNFDDEVQVRNDIGDRFDALDLSEKRQLVSALVTVTVFPGRGPERVIVDYLAVPSLNDEDQDDEPVGPAVEADGEPDVVAFADVAPGFKGP